MDTLFFIHIGVLICIYSMLGVSLNLAIGYAGLLNLGHVAFFGIGAYTSAILTVMYGMSLPVAMCAAFVSAGIAGWILMWLVKKLSGDYLALATLGFTFIIFSLFNNLRSITRGASGIFGIPKPEIFGVVLRTPQLYIWFAAAIAILAILFVWRVTTSRFGKVLEAVRDDQIGAAAFGKNIHKVKYIAMMLSAGIAGVAGSVFAHYITYIDPTIFFLSELIILFTIVMVGGLGTIRGTILAAILIICLQEGLRYLPLTPGLLGPLRQIIFAIMLLVVLLYRPRGIAGRVELE